MKVDIKGSVNALVVAAYGIIGTAHADGLPTISGPSGTSSSSSDPTGQLKSYFGWGICIIAFGLMAITFLTVAKNGWQKYHQLGEEGSKTTWRDLASNVVVGVLLLCLSGYMLNKAIDILGTTSL